MVLNHYAINQIVGGTMAAGPRHRFGHFGLLGVLGTALKNRPRPNAKVSFDIDADRIVFDAFIKVYDGNSPENLLLHDSLASKFHSQARKLGLHASAADINRRLINIRKNPARYAKYGIRLPEATKKAPRPSIVPGYAHVIEFAISKLRYRYGVTIDDILIDPDLTHEYEAMAHAAAPAVSSLDLRLGALYIRKTRYIAKKNAGLVESLNHRRINELFEDAGTIRSVRTASIPRSVGLIEILENGRYLYISRSDDLRSAAEHIGSESTLGFMSNEFWQPNPDNLRLRVFAGSEFLKVPISSWQLQLIRVNRPVFNYPVAAHDLN